MTAKTTENDRENGSSGKRLRNEFHENSTIFRGNSMIFHGFSVIFHGYSIKFHRYSIKFHGYSIKFRIFASVLVNNIYIYKVWKEKSI